MIKAKTKPHNRTCDTWREREMLAAGDRPSPRNKFNQTDKAYWNVRYNV